MIGRKAFKLGLGMISGALLALSFVAPASASMMPISGGIGFVGTNSWNTTTQTFTIGSASVNATSGDFATAIALNTAATFPTPLGGIDYTDIAGTLGSTPLFSATSGANTATLTVISNGYSVTSNTLSMSGYATLTLTGYLPTEGTFTFTSNQNGGLINFSSTAAVPGPLLGAGLPGLLVGCGGILVLLRRRRLALA